MHGSLPQPALADDARSACAAWFGPDPPEVRPLATSGFSGVTTLRVRPRGGAAWFVLKSFAAGTPRDRAAWVHAFAARLTARGVVEVPAPRPSLAGDTLVTDVAGVHWELVPFVEGEVTDTPDVARASSALAALARLHLAGATLPGPPSGIGAAPAVLRRQELAAALVVRPWSLRRANAIANGPLAAAVAARRDRAIDLLDAPRGRRAVAAIARWPADPVPLQAVLRDVWSDHVIFAPGGAARVAGIVDLHAAASDTPATDVARLMGSWRPSGGPHSVDPAVGWPEALVAYEAIRPLSAAERAAVPLLDAAGVVGGLDHWFRWTLEEGRSFPSAAAVITRIDRLLDRLPAAIEWLAAT